MAASNSVQIQISVTTAGVYSISTNTVTGFSFAGTGTVAVGPNQLINLAATGTPTTAGPQTFLVTFGTSTCTFVVNVLPNDYFPRTTGSNWSYEFDDNANDSLYRNAITPTLAVGADTYNIFMQNDGVTPPLIPLVIIAEVAAITLNGLMLVLTLVIIHLQFGPLI